MDLFSMHQSQKYDSILEQINSEYEKSDHLKRDINSENDKLVALKLVQSQNVCISHLCVKVFNLVNEIQNLYVEEFRNYDFTSLSKYNSCKFYLFEIYIPKIVLEKFVGAKWKLQISVEAAKYSTCKVTGLSKDVARIFEIIPIRADIKECNVKTSLFLQSKDNWNVIALNSLEVDISYHFESYKDVKNKYKHLHESLQKIPKLHNPSTSSDAGNNIELEAAIPCNFTNQEFIQCIVRNSYHRFNLQQFAELENESKPKLELQFYVFNGKIYVSYDKEMRLLKIRAGAEDMVHLKKYFGRFANYDYNQVKSRLQDLEARKADGIEDSLQDVLGMYKDTRKTWL